MIGESIWAGTAESFGGGRKHFSDQSTLCKDEKLEGVGKVRKIEITRSCQRNRYQFTRTFMLVPSPSV